MDTKFEFGNELEKIVYVKPVAATDLPPQVQAQAQAEGIETLYAVHNADGEQLALVADQKMAFALARQHDMAPVQVH